MPSFTGSLSPRLSRLCVCHPLFSTSGWESLCRVLYLKVNFLREGLSVGLLHRFGAWHTIIGQPLQASCNPILHSYQFSSVAQTCLTLCDPMNRSMPGLPVHHQLPEFTQTHVHRVGDAIQPSHPLSSPSPPAFSLSQRQGLFL